MTSNEIIFAITLNATKIRITPNGDVKNLRLEVFACSHYGKTSILLLNIFIRFCLGNETTTTTTKAPCILTEWSVWTPCSRTCGIGYQTRTRNASSPIGCEEEPLVDHQSCNNRRCQCLLDEAFYLRVFKKPSTNDSTYTNLMMIKREIKFIFLCRRNRLYRYIS